jgi:hypothetical protein
MTKPTINVVKATKATPIKNILTPIKNNDDNDNDDDGETFDEVLYNTCI